MSGPRRPPAGWPIAIGTTVEEFPRDGGDPAQGHHVALAWVVNPSATWILLVRHRERGWSCPGGHVEVGERLVVAAGRELAEETGLTATPLVPAPFTLARSIGCPRRPGREIVHWAAGFVFVVEPTVPLVTERDQPARWWPLDDLPTPRPADVDFVAGHLRSDGLP